MKCPSCQNEMSIDPADTTKVVCYTCRKRYPATKVEQYWSEVDRLANDKVKVGEEAYAGKTAPKPAATPASTAATPAQPAATPRYGTPYIPQEVQTTPSVAKDNPVYQSSYQPAPQPVQQPVIQVQPAQPIQQPAQVAQPQPVQAQPAQPVYPQAQPYQQPVYQQPVYPQGQYPQGYQQPVYPQGQYPQAYPQAYVPPADPYQNDPIAKKARGLGIAALCCGIAGLIILPVLVGGTGVGLGIGSLVVSSKNARPKSGMAIAGIVVGGIAVVIGVLQAMSGYLFGYYY